MPVPLYHTFAGNPHYNMAFDEWLLGRALSVPGWTALRLYTWDRPTITFGFNQKAVSAFDATRLGGTPVIRRVTGGRALLHQRSELTYCVAARPSGGASSAAWPRSISTAHRAVASGLVAFLRGIGIDCTYARASSPENARPDFFHKAPCFASHARYEIMGARGKLVASAARRVGDAMLMHGAIKIDGVVAHPALPSDGAEHVSDENDKAVDRKRFAESIDRFRTALADALDMEVNVADLSHQESEQILRAAAFVRKNELVRRALFEQIAL